MSVPRTRRYPLRPFPIRLRFTMPTAMTGEQIAAALRHYYQDATRAAQDGAGATQTAYRPTRSHQPAERPTA